MSAEVNAVAALARHESQNAGDPFHFSLTNHLYVALRDLLASRVSTPPSEPHPVKPISKSGRVDVKTFCGTCRGSLYIADNGEWAHVATATPPTDEDERDEIATIVDDVMEAARRRGDVATPYEISGAILAASSRAVTTPEPRWRRDALMIRDAVDEWEASGDDEKLVNEVIDPWIKRVLSGAPTEGEA